MSAITDRIDGLRDRFERLTPRERTMVSALGLTFLVTVTLMVTFLVSDAIAGREERNQAMRQALRDLDTHRETYLKAKAKADLLEGKLSKSGTQLQGYLEAAAKETGVQIPDSSEKPPLPAGKSFIERSVDLRLTKVTLDALAKFMKKVETGTSLVAVTSLNIRTRDDKHVELDVEMSVSTYERAVEKKDKDKDKSKPAKDTPAGAKGGDKDKDKDL